ncbi:metal-dependent hydrolase [Halorubellus litoreus]|uniref:Metal-dependent hydrolase n=1 Tax=Halorubellus litoreus TaxID=755308 RepID=A0ABD5VMX2_9EURY
MWPWEHLGFAYVLYSIVSRVAFGESPRGDGVLVVAFASLLPDLVDKPLSWTLEVTETGYSVAHSAFVAPLLVGIVVAVAGNENRPRLAAAFVVGYLSHLVGDVVYPAIRGGELAVHAVLWPVVVGEPGNYGGLLQTFNQYFSRFLHEVASGELSAVLVFELALVSFTALVWALDGFPVLRELYRSVADHLWN